MAKKAKKAKKEPTRKFYIASSECGDMEQFEFHSLDGSFASAEAAKKKIEKCIADGDWDSAGVFYVFEIVATGKPSGALNWK